MNITHLTKLNSEDRKTKMKSMRIRNKAYDSLELMKKRTGLSVNEIVNRVAEQLGAEYKFLEEIEKEIKINKKVNIIGHLNSGYTVYFVITENENIMSKLKYKSVYSIYKFESVIGSNEIYIDDLHELLDFGLNSNYEIYRQQPKLKESE